MILKVKVNKNCIHLMLVCLVIKNFSLYGVYKLNLKLYFCKKTMFAEEIS